MSWEYFWHNTLPLNEVWPKSSNCSKQWGSNLRVSYKHTRTFYKESQLFSINPTFANTNKLYDVNLNFQTQGLWSSFRQEYAKRVCESKTRYEQLLFSNDSIAERCCGWEDPTGDWGLALLGRPGLWAIISWSTFSHIQTLRQIVQTSLSYNKN